MPLKLADLAHPSSTNILNKWADDKEQTLDSHSTQIKTLTNIINSLLTKNPTLAKPNGVK